MKVVRLKPLLLPIFVIVIFCSYVMFCIVFLVFVFVSVFLFFVLFCFVLFFFFGGGGGRAETDKDSTPQTSFHAAV